MLIERNQVLVGIVAAIVVLAGTAFALVTTGSTILVRGMRVEAAFADASGLESGDFVYVSGVRAGTVTDVAQDGDHVRVEFALTSDGWIPDDSTIAVILANTLGKRGLAITPGASTTALADGDSIPIERTRPIVDIPEFGDETEELLANLDVDALRQLTVSLADITQGQRGDVDRLLDGVQQISDVLVRRRDQLSGTIESARRLVGVVESRDDEIIQIIDNFQITLDTLLANRDQIERLLVETASASTSTADLVSERRAQIDRVLASLSEDLAIIDAHQVDLAHMLAYGGVAIDGFSSIGYVNLNKDDTGQWANVFTTGIGAVGTDATLGCGSPLDDVLTELFGPDPACDGIHDVDPDAASSDEAAAAPASTRLSGPATFFQPGLMLTRGPAASDVRAASTTGVQR